MMGASTLRAVWIPWCMFIGRGTAFCEASLGLPDLTVREGSMDQRFFLSASHDFIVSGFSFGFRHDPALLAITEGTFEGTALAALPQRVDEDGFWNLAIDEMKGEVVCGAVLTFSPSPESLLPPAADHSLARFTCRVMAAAGQRVALELADGLGGSFPVENVLVDEQGGSRPPVLRSGSFAVSPLRIGDGCGAADDALVQLAATPVGETSAPCRFHLRNLGAAPLPVQVLAITGDRADFAFLDAGGRPIEGTSVITVPGGAESTVDALFLPRTAGQKAASADLLAGGARFQLTASGLAQPAVRFLRPDANADGRINIVDPILLVIHLYRGGPEPPCLDAGDFNDDGKIDVTDFTSALWFLFLAGDGPAPPFPGCGPDAQADLLRCRTACVS